MIALDSNIGQSSFSQAVAGNNKFSSSLKGIVSSTMIFLQHPCNKGRGEEERKKLVCGLASEEYVRKL